jgi:chromate reductase
MPCAGERAENRQANCPGEGRAVAAADGESAWNGKAGAIVGASIGSSAAVRAQYHLRQMMAFLNVFQINQPEVMIGNASQRFDP